MFINRVHLSVLLLSLMSALSAAEFRVEGTVIIGPDGKEFIPMGANINGPDWVWTNETLQHASPIADVWGFNTVRLNCIMDIDNKDLPTFTINNDLDAIVEAFTSRGVVVQIEAHDFTGIYPDDDQLVQLAAWHADLATRFKDNPYVWFNVMNEPGGSGAVSPRYLTVHRTVIQAIRDTGSTNIIVCDAASWGQDTGSWNARPVPEENSALLTYGPTLIAEFSNVTFAFHVYDQWAYGDDKMIDYIQRVRAAGLSVHVGEYGTNQPDNPDASNTKAMETLGRVAGPARLGILAWHYQPGDGFALTIPGNGSRITFDEDGQPDNLRRQGEILWDLLRSYDDDDGIDGLGRRIRMNLISGWIWEAQTPEEADVEAPFAGLQLISVPTNSDTILVPVMDGSDS